MAHAQSRTAGSGPILTGIESRQNGDVPAREATIGLFSGGEAAPPLGNPKRLYAGRRLPRTSIQDNSSTLTRNLPFRTACGPPLFSKDHIEEGLAAGEEEKASVQTSAINQRAAIPAVSLSAGRSPSLRLSDDPRAAIILRGGLDWQAEGRFC